MVGEDESSGNEDIKTIRRRAVVGDRKRESKECQGSWKWRHKRREGEASEASLVGREMGKRENRDERIRMLPNREEKKKNSFQSPAASEEKLLNLSSRLDLRSGGSL